jgi:hypothetical protein
VEQPGRRIDIDNKSKGLRRKIRIPPLRGTARVGIGFRLQAIKVIVKLRVLAGNGSKEAALSSAFSELWLRWGQFPGDHFVNETHAVVAAVAKRLIGGVPAPAK